MINYITVYKNNNKVVCRGSIESTKIYLNMLNISLNEVSINELHYVTPYYDDFDLRYIKDLNIYLPSAIIDIIEQSIEEEKYGLTYIERKFNDYINSDIFSKDVVNTLHNMIDDLQDIKLEHQLYLKTFFNLDIKSVKYLENKLYENRIKEGLINEFKGIGCDNNDSSCKRYR